MSAHGFPNLVVVQHPLVQHKLTRLRDRQTGTRDFKALVHDAIDRVTSDRVCTHCLAHEGVELPFDLP